MIFWNLGEKVGLIPHNLSYIIFCIIRSLPLTTTTHCRFSNIPWESWISGISRTEITRSILSKFVWNKLEVERSGRLCKYILRNLAHRRRNSYITSHLTSFTRLMPSSCSSNTNTANTSTYFYNFRTSSTVQYNIIQYTYIHL